MPRVFLPQILWHSKDNKRCDRVYSLDFQPDLETDVARDNPLAKKSVTRLRLATGGADEFVHIWQILIHNQAPQYTHFVNQSLKKEEFEQPLSIKILARLTGHIGEVNAVRWSHDGKLLATGGEDRCIFLWAKDETGNPQGDYEENWTRTHYFRLSNVVNSISWCQENRIIAVSTEDGHISLVDTQIEGAGKIRYFDGHTNIAQGVALDPKNELLASLGSDQCLRIWKRRNQKSWKSILVLKGARDKGETTSEDPENAQEIRRYGRYVFMSEELKTFFRRLDWSPDGRILVTPTGIRNISKEGEVSQPVYTLYMFYRKLINFGIPMISHQSPTGPFVVVRFCPIYLSTIDKQKSNFLNKLMQGGNKNVKLKPVVKKQKTEKAGPMSVNKIDSYFCANIRPKEESTNSGEANDHSTPELKIENGVPESTKMDKEDVCRVKEEQEALGTGEEHEQMGTSTEPRQEHATLETLLSYQEAPFCRLSENSPDYAPVSMEDNLTTIDSQSPVKVLEHEDTTSLPEMIKMESIDDNVEDGDHNGRLEGAYGVSMNDDSQDDHNDHYGEMIDSHYDHSHSNMDDETTHGEWAEDVEKTDGLPETPRELDQNNPDATPVTKGPETETTDVEQGGRAYNLRKRTSVIRPIFFDNSVRREPRRRVVKKPKPKEPIEKEEDYDTDLEQEVTIPRFIFATGTVDGSVCFYDTNENGGPIAVLKNLHFCPITDISWSPDGYVCASSSSDGYITFVIFNKRELS